MQNARRSCSGKALMLRGPSFVVSSNTTISPGSTSRTNFAWIRSSAQVSLASTQASPILPMHNGRKPCGSRTPINSFSVMITSEYAPSMRRIVCTRLLSRPPRVGCAMRCRMISLSTVVWKIDPLDSSSSRSCAALVKFPLCAIAICPLEQSTVKGCAFASSDEPVVE